MDDETPRTDAEIARFGPSMGTIPNLFARTLECELISSKKREAALQEAVEKCLLAGGYDAKGDTQSADELFAQARVILAQNGR